LVNYKDATDIARTGLKSSSRRLNVSASNTANMQTDGFEKTRFEQMSQKGGGVKSTTDTVELSDAAKKAADQLDGTQNNVNLAEEMVSQMKAEAEFKANISTIDTANDMEKSLLRMMN
jgi:flagellar basal-body rod protein FlgC